MRYMDVRSSWDWRIPGAFLLKLLKEETRYANS